MAGVNISIKSAFDYGVDGDFRPIKEVTLPNGIIRRVESGFNVDFQAKATKNWEKRDNNIIYDMEAKNYNDIVGRDRAATSLILVLLCLPGNVNDWHSTSETQTILRHSCYWAVPSGPLTCNTATKRILVPTANLLTPDVVKGLLRDERERRLGQQP